jgi:hypothetical protein
MAARKLHLLAEQMPLRFAEKSKPAAGTGKR